MKGVILCAGEGTRLRPLTWTRAKHLLPIANRPVIDLILEAVKEAGIKDVGLVISPNMEDQFRGHLGDGSPWGLRLNYILQREPKGLAHAVQCAEQFVGDGPFLVYLGDNLLERGVKGLVERFSHDHEAPNAMISLAEVEDPRRFGVAIVEGSAPYGEIKRLIEKPKVPPSNLAIVGAYIFDHHIFEAIGKIRPSFRGELEITDAIQRLIDDGYRVLPYMVEGWWKDVGEPEDMLEANRLLLERMEPKIEGELDEGSKTSGPVAVAKGAKIKGSRLIGPLVIGADAVIESSIIGPYASIGDRAQIRGSEVSNSIIMEGARVEGLRLKDSLIGRDSEIEIKLGGRFPSSSYNLIVGDNSRISAEGWELGGDGQAARN